MASCRAVGSVARMCQRYGAAAALRWTDMAGTLTARDLHKAHGAATILAGVSVTVAPGDVLGVVGPNGAGKSTLLRILAGLDRPDRGTVQLSAGAAGYLPQEPDRAPGERLEEYLARRTGVAAADARVARRRRRARRRTRPAPTTATPTRSRPGSRSAGPISSSGRRPSCATWGSIPRCSTSRPSRCPAARPRARRSPRSCSRASTSCCSTSRRTTSTSTGSRGSSASSPSGRAPP